jgi:putative flippase GtrA
MGTFQLPGDERSRYLIVGAWNVAFGYGLFVGIVALLGRNGYLAASWLAWIIAAPQSALTMKYLAYRKPGRVLPEFTRAYFLYLAPQGLTTVLLWTSVRLLGMPPALAGLVSIAVAAVLSYIAHTYLAFRPPLVVGEVPSDGLLRDHGITETLEALWRHGSLAVVGLARDVVLIPQILVWARREGMKPYVFFANLDYHHNSAGNRAFFRLIHELNERGMRACSLKDVNPEWNQERITRLGYWVLRALSDPVVVYPEGVSGNPLRARHVVRWVLYTPGVLGGDTDYEDTELVFAWSRSFYDTDRILRVDTLQRDLFNAAELPDKTVDCVYLGKAKTRGVKELPQTFDMTRITAYPPWPPTRESLASLLRRTRVLYTYDDHSLITEEALLCGCRVVLLPEGRDITWADAEPESFDTDYDAQMTRFIEETQWAWHS